MIFPWNRNLYAADDDNRFKLNLPETAVISCNCELADNMDQLPMLEASDDQSTAGRGVNDTRYRNAHSSDRDVEDDNIQGALIPEPTGQGSYDPRSGCDRATDPTSEVQQDEEFDVDRAGQRGGKFRRDSSTLESWDCVVHQHHTALNGDGHGIVSSRGVERGRSGDDDGTNQHELVYIMRMPDEEARLRALRRYLARQVKTGR